MSDKQRLQTKEEKVMFCIRLPRNESITIKTLAARDSKTIERWVYEVLTTELRRIGAAGGVR